MAGESARLGPAHVRKVVSIDRESGEGARGRSVFEHRVCIRRYRAPHSTVIFVQNVDMVNLGEVRGMPKVFVGQLGLAARAPSSLSEVQEVPAGTTLRVTAKPTPKRLVMGFMPCSEDPARP
ncbi:hypothetical protein GW17_00031594 [Ensete ventricosum]|nr:hypothetical protein GW17_00031594 [Ensete ventricosum]